MSGHGGGGAAERCSQLLREQARDIWLATLLSPPDERPRQWAIWALAGDALRLPWTVSEPLMGAIRLQWWQEALAELSGHPLLTLLEKRDIRPLDDFLRATGRLHGGPFESPEEAGRWGRAAFIPLLEALGGSAANKAERALARAFGIAALLRLSSRPTRGGTNLTQGGEFDGELRLMAMEALKRAKPLRLRSHHLPFTLARPWLTGKPTPQWRLQLYLLARHLLKRA